MLSPAEKLAESLGALRALQDRGVLAIRSRDLTRRHRERLLANGFLEKVMKGWYIASRPGEAVGDSSAWYASFWEFCAAYLAQRFGADWCLSPEQSLSLHAGNRLVPRQLLVRSPKGRNRVTGLPYGTSLLDLRSAIPESRDEIDHLRVFSPVAALVSCSPGYFRQNPTDIRVCLSAVQDASDVLILLLRGGHSTIAGRLAGAFRNIGRDRIADDIMKTMRAAGYELREKDPFETTPPRLVLSREISPEVSRIRLMWRNMRETVLQAFPRSPGMPEDITQYLKGVEELYMEDTYHSLSIEGYRVSRALIARVRSGSWDPDGEDRDQRDALAARGYWQAFQSVRESIKRVLFGDEPGLVADEDHGRWYREMFGPAVNAGVLRPADLAGYRDAQVFISRSMHIPPRSEAIRDLMPVFFELLCEESESSVRAVMGHFFFVYIHPYPDGNGRMGRFLMNLMLAAGGYPWTVIPVGERERYMTALEEASTRQNILPFTDLLGRLVRQGLEGASEARPSE